VYPKDLNPPLIELQQISVCIDERDILKNIDFTLNKKEIVTLIGPTDQGTKCGTDRCSCIFYDPCD